MRNLKKFKAGFIVSSIFYIVLGIILIIWPQISIRVICKLFGLLILALGIGRVIRYFSNIEYDTPFQLDFAHGILNILIGIFMLISPNALVIALPVVLGIVILIDSVLRLQISIDLKRLQYDDWLVSFILALVTTVFGVLLLFNPFVGSMVLTRFIGISLTIDGIINLWILIYVSNKVREYDLW